MFFNVTFTWIQMCRIKKRDLPKVCWVMYTIIRISAFSSNWTRPWFRAVTKISDICLRFLKRHKTYKNVLRYENKNKCLWIWLSYCSIMSINCFSGIVKKCFIQNRCMESSVIFNFFLEEKQAKISRMLQYIAVIGHGIESAHTPSGLKCKQGLADNHDVHFLLYSIG